LKQLSLPGEDDEIQVMLENIPFSNEALKQIKQEISQKSVQKVEKKFILNALVRSNWNVTKAASGTGLQRTNFQNLMKKYGISRPKGLQKNDS